MVGASHLSDKTRFELFAIKKKLGAVFGKISFSP